MSHDALAAIIDAAWEKRTELNAATKGEVREAVDFALQKLDSGELRVATKGDDGAWTTHQWLKKGGAALVSPQ